MSYAMVANHAWGNGGAIFMTGAEVTISDYDDNDGTTISFNDATYGGGIDVAGGSTLLLANDAHVEFNHADDYGGGLRVSGADILVTVEGTVEVHVSADALLVPDVDADWALSLASPGDLDGDGRADLLVGSPTAQVAEAGPQVGAAWVILGAATGF